MEFTILKDIVIIFALSTLVNLVFTKIKIPTVVGYLLTGIIAGPHLLSLVDGKHEIELMAEIGVVLLLFTIGMEFSLKQLLKMRILPKEVIARNGKGLFFIFILQNPKVKS